MARPRLHAVILAGGAGERFWPASRQKHPKPFLEIADGKTLLDATVDRARRFASKDCVWVVCGADHAKGVRRATGLPAERLLVEPTRRNTAMAVAWAAQRIAVGDPAAVLAILPADHRIPDAKAFASAMRRAARAAREGEALITLGVKPTRPDTGYGYIRVGKPAGRRWPGVRRVRRFVEKPNAARARRYLREGGYLWNAGIFVFRADTLLEELARHAPEIFQSIPRGKSAAAVARAYEKAPSEPIDTALMERSKKIWTLPVTFHWSDVGTWLSLAEELGVSDGKSRVLGGELLFDDTGGNLVWGAPRRGIALLGVHGLAVIDTGDVLLVTKLDRSADVRGIVARLKKRGRSDVT